MNKLPILACKKLGKTFGSGNLQVNVLQNLDFQVYPGEQVAIIGASGTGKSTLLHLLGGLDTPTSGQVMILGKNWQTLSEPERCQLRNQQLGFVYQFHHLLPEFSVLENVSMPLLIANEKPAVAQQKARIILEKVGLTNRLEHRLGELSGGERQRTAIARALVTRPLCVLADELTGNLDPKTAHRIYDIILELNHELGTSFVVVTHDERLAAKMHRVVELINGRLIQR